jgi:methyltransferase (TIGR00027 family)
MKEDAPSATALLVARGVAFQATHPEHGKLVDDETRDLTVRLVKSARKRVRSGASRISRRLVALQERLTVPGLTLHYVLRKRAIEKLVHVSIAEGFPQLIVIGGGLDTLAIRLAPAIRAIELDHPATQSIKRAAIENVPNLELLSLDLANDNVADTLGAAQSYRGSEPAVVVIEAVLMYLWEADVRQAFRQLAARSAKTRVIFTFMEQPYFRGATLLAKWWLARAGEPPRWTIDIDAIPSFISHLGFKLTTLIRDGEYQRGYDDAAMGEHIAVAERA